MMPYKMRQNSGSLFRNEKRESENFPNATGKALIACPHCGATAEHWMSAWTKEGQKGRWQSLAFQPVEEPKAPPKPAPIVGSGFDDMTDDIPF